jgi:hypothetical protein
MARKFSIGPRSRITDTGTGVYFLEPGGRKLFEQERHHGRRERDEVTW